MTSPPPDSRPQKIGHLALNLGILTQLHTTRMEALLAPHEVSVAQFSILNHLARRADSPCRISDIARSVEVQQPAVTKAIAKFEVMGLVTVSGDARDQRSRLVTLSEAGFGHLAAVRQTLIPTFKACFEGWSDGEIDQFSAYLRRLGFWYDTNRL